MDPKEIASGIMKTLENAWNSTDGTAFSMLFTDICDFVDIRGEAHLSASKDDIAMGHQQLFDTIYKGSVNKNELLQANNVDNNTIVAHVKATLNCPHGPLAGINNSVFSMVLVNNDGKWQIRTFHNTVVVKR